MYTGAGLLVAFGALYLIVIVLALASVIWVIYDVLANQKKMPDGEKILWIIVALLLGIIGAIVYYLVVKRSGKYEEELEEPISKENTNVW